MVFTTLQRLRKRQKLGNNTKTQWKKEAQQVKKMSTFVNVNTYLQGMWEWKHDTATDSVSL